MDLAQLQREHDLLLEQNRQLKLTLNKLIETTENFSGDIHTKIEQYSSILQKPKKNVKKKIRSTSDGLIESPKNLLLNSVNNSNNTLQNIKSDPHYLQQLNVKIIQPSQKEIEENNSQKEKSKAEEPAEISSPNGKRKKKSKTSKTSILALPTRSKNKHDKERLEWTSTMHGKDVVTILFHNHTQREIDKFVKFIDNFINTLPQEKKLEWYHGQCSVVKHGPGREIFINQTFFRSFLQIHQFYE